MPTCGGLSAFRHHHADRLKIPLVHPRRDHDFGCGHCGTPFFATELCRREEALPGAHASVPPWPAAACAA